MTGYDILIAGAGPAGLSAAYSAAKSGAKVAVFEKSKEIGYPVHTSGGSWIDELEKLEIPHRFMHPIDEAVFMAPHTRAVFKYKKAPSCILDVRGLYQYLAGLASAAGASIFVNSTVTAPILVDNCIRGLSVRRMGRQQNFEAKLLIDATGAHSFLGRKLGLTDGFKRMGLGAELELYAPGWPQARVAFIFGDQVAPSGYAWVFPRGESRVRAGVGLISPDVSGNPKHFLRKLIENRELFGDELETISEIEYHSGIIPSETPIKQTTSDGIIIVGDAGGLISTLLGEGIRFCIDIGRMAGNVAGEAVRRQSYKKRTLRRFDILWQKKYKRLFGVGQLLNRRLAAYRDEDWDRRIADLSRLDPDVIPMLLKGNFKPYQLIKLAANTSFLKNTVLTGLANVFKKT